MVRTLLILAAGIGVGLGGTTWARHDDGKDPKRAVLSATDIAERVDGKAAKATTVELTMGPGQGSAPHRHPGPVFGYVIEGEYEWAIDDRPARVLKAGETFYEPAGCLHRVSANPGKVKTRLLAWVIHPKGAKDIAVPEKHRP